MRKLIVLSSMVTLIPLCQALWLTRPSLTPKVVPTTPAPAGDPQWAVSQ